MTQIKMQGFQNNSGLSNSEPIIDEHKKSPVRVQANDSPYKSPAKSPYKRSPTKSMKSSNKKSPSKRSPKKQDKENMQFPLIIDKKMSSRIEELQKLYQDKGWKMNFHEHFKDLNPTYHRKRYERSKKLANTWLGQIRLNLKSRLEEEARKNFVAYLKDGKRLTFQEL